MKKNDHIRPTYCIQETRRVHDDDKGALVGSNLTVPRCAVLVQIGGHCYNQQLI